MGVLREEVVKEKVEMEFVKKNDTIKKPILK